MLIAKFLRVREEFWKMSVAISAGNIHPSRKTKRQLLLGFSFADVRNATLVLTWRVAKVLLTLIGPTFRSMSLMPAWYITQPTHTAPSRSFATDFTGNSAGPFAFGPWGWNQWDFCFKLGHGFQTQSCSRFAVS